MSEVPVFVLVLLAPGAIVLGVLGLRGLLDIHEALRGAELARLSAPVNWQATRAFMAVCAALPVWLAAAPLGASALGAAAATAALAYGVAPRFLDALRRRAAHMLLDELALHLDLIAPAVEACVSLASAITTLRRANGSALSGCPRRL